MILFRNFFLVLTGILLAAKLCECGVYSLIRDLIQWNVAGTPTFHRVVEWDFDPDVSQKRRDLFYELHGYRAEKYLENIGNGFDGNHKKREFENAERDKGRVQGLNLLAP